MKKTYDVIAVAGYRDTIWHLKLATLGWRLRYGLRVHTYRFGTVDEFGNNAKPEMYDELSEEFEDFRNNIGRAAIMGTSFGVTIADRAIIDHPDQVPCIVDVSGPHDISALNAHTIDTKYQMLRPSLGAYKASDLPLQKVMTIRPKEDEVINPEHVWLEGATNLQVGVRGHGPGIFAGIVLKSGEIAQFIRGHMDEAA